MSYTLSFLLQCIGQGFGRAVARGDIEDWPLDSIEPGSTGEPDMVPAITTQWLPR